MSSVLNTFTDYGMKPNRMHTQLPNKMSLTKELVIPLGGNGFFQNHLQ